MVCKSKSYGFVSFREKSAADCAYREMHNSLLGDQKIAVEFAKPATNKRA